MNADGDKLGEHCGLVRHTIGQRRGIGIPRAEPLYVLRLDTDHNRLVVGSRQDAEAPALTAENVTFTTGGWPAGPLTCEVSVRYRGAPVAAVIDPAGAGWGEVAISFPDQRPIAAPGQAIVFYRDDEVLGGGTIAYIMRDAERTQMRLAEPARS